MATGAHLGIPLREYDARIRTFIPSYDEMLDEAAAALPPRGGQASTIVDLGTGSGALASGCASVWPRARLIGIDSDAGMLQMASARLGRRLAIQVGDFETAALPSTDAIVSAFALHHVPTVRRKAALYRKCRRALRPGGVLIIADCQLSSRADLAAVDRAAWLSHLQQYYSAAESRAFLRAWAKEDHYFTLTDELSLLSSAGFTTDVRWRRYSFAVIVASR
jgi:trans-aconitate methyltransferase